MTCDKALKLINAYISGDEVCFNEEFFEHINSCENCRREYEEVEDIITALNNTEYVPLPENFHNELREKLKNEKGKKHKVKYAKYAAVAACAGVIFIGSSFLTGNMNSDFMNMQSRDVASKEIAMPRVAAEYGESSSSAASMPDTESYAVSEEAGSEMAGNINTLDSGYSDCASVSNVMTERSSALNEKIIKTGYMNITVDNYDDAFSNIEEYINQKGGYIQNSSSQVYYENENSSEKIKSGYITVKIKQDDYENFKDFAETLGDIMSQDEYTEDVTEQYTDIETRIMVKESERARLTELMEESEDVSEIITIEERLSDVIADVENMKSKLNVYDNKINYSTFNITLSERKEGDYNKHEETFINMISYSMRNSADGFLIFLKSAVICFVGLWVPALITVVFVAVFVIIYKKLKKSKNNKKERN